MWSDPVLVLLGTAAVMGAAVWAAVRRAASGGPRTPQDEWPDDVGDPAVPVYRGEARAALASLLVGCAGAAVMCLIGSWWERGYGVAYAVAGGTGALIGLLAYLLHPRPTWHPGTDGRVVAELTPRGPTSFGRRWVFALPLASAVILILGLLLTGSYSATDENGLHRIFQRRSLSGWGVEDGQVVDVQYTLSSTGPFPGWYYGVPVIICTMLLAAVVHWALRRTATAPRPAAADLFAADTFLRARRTMFIMTASSAALAFQVAGLAAVTGSVLRAAHRDPVPTADLDAVVGTVPVEPGHTLALMMIVSSAVLALVAVSLLVKALAVIADLWRAGSGAPRVRRERVR